MYRLATLVFALIPHASMACDQAVCLVDPDALALPQVITFDDIRAGYGPGHLVDDILDLQGARFGEHFVGQRVSVAGAHDQVEGPAMAPLTLMPGPEGQNLSVVFFSGNQMLNGYGVAGFPRRDAQGEGAIAVLFDDDQAALAFDLRGGETGAALVHFLARNGALLASVTVQPVGEFTVGFERVGGYEDIAGIVITNTDAQGMAIDTLRFGRLPGLS